MSKPARLHVDNLPTVFPNAAGLEVRVWYPPVEQLGKTAYPAHGFIHPRRPATYAELARAIPAAARYALDTAGRPAPRARIDG